MITEGLQLLGEALGSTDFGIYTLQAAISATHAQAASPADTDWSQIASLYDVLLETTRSPIVECDTQDELDYFWEKLSFGGGPCSSAMRLAQRSVWDFLADCAEDTI